MNKYHTKNRRRGARAMACLEQLEGRCLLSGALQVTDTIAPTNDLALPMANTFIGQTSATQSFTLHNSGPDPLNVTSLNTTGNTGDYTVTVKDHLGTTVTTDFTIANEDYTIQVAFHPTQAGSRTASITFNTDDPGHANVSLSLGGTGVQPSLPSLTITDDIPPDADSAVSFGVTDVGKTGDTGTFTLDNSGEGALNVTNFGKHGWTPNDFDVVVYDDNGDPVNGGSFAVPSATAYTVDVTFAPTAAGNRTGTITFNTNDPGHGSVTLFMSGTAIPHAKPAAPSGLTATAISSGQINLRWTDNAANEDGYRVYRATSATGTYTLKKTLPADSTTYSYIGLPAGTRCYFKVVAFNDLGESTAALANTATPADLAGNTLATARNQGTLVGISAVRDFVGAPDANDWYKVTLALPGTLRLNMTELGTDLDLALVKLGTTGTPTVLNVSENSGTTSEAISRSLPAGTFYVHVYKGVDSANSTYRLTFEADYAGNTRAAARSLGALSTSRTYNDFAGAGDRDDYYKFTLAATKTFTLALSGLKGDLDVELQGSTGTVITTSENEATASEAITRQLAKGTYYIHVLYWQGLDTNYKLTVAAT